MMRFSRDAALSRLADEQFDVLVIGGGITGAGVALDAASRGLHTGLVEPPDPTNQVPARGGEARAAGSRSPAAQAAAARLTLTIARTAVLDHGAVAANYAGVTGLLKDAGGQVVGARVGDIDVRARVVVNA